MRIHYDPTEDAVYIRFHETPYCESDEVRRGVIMDYDEGGRVIGLEVLNVSKNLPASFLDDIRGKRVQLELTKHAVA
jgi:uncharacterized protein YuzE